MTQVFLSNNTTIVVDRLGWASLTELNDGERQSVMIFDLSAKKWVLVHEGTVVRWESVKSEGRN